MPSTFVSNEDAPTIAPQDGKRYYTRNGRETTPLRRNGMYFSAEVLDGNHDHTRSWETTGEHMFGVSQFDLIAEVDAAQPDAEPATPSPVRRRTVTEIVPGTYGRIGLRDASPAQGFVTIALLNERYKGDGHQYLNAAELRAAAATLVALADALDEMAGDSK